jgi:hypothetical protein
MRIGKAVFQSASRIHKSATTAELLSSTRQNSILNVLKKWGASNTAGTP